MRTAQKLHEALIQRRLTLSTAESVTGGAIAAQLVQYSGASAYFMGSVVAYSDESKKNILKVSSSTLEKEGAVSQRVAEEMVVGVNRLFLTDLSISTTGIAGPSGESLHKSLGTVYAGLFYKGKILLWRSHFEGGRLSIIHQTVEDVFNKLLNLL